MLYRLGACFSLVKSMMRRSWSYCGTAESSCSLLMLGSCTDHRDTMCGNMEVPMILRTLMLEVDDRMRLLLLGA